MVGSKTASKDSKSFLEFTGAGFRDAFPLSILAISRISLIKESRNSLEDLIFWI